MNGAEFINHVTRDRSDFLGEILGILDDRRIAYCVIGGWAVNAYAEPVVSLDLDLVIVTDVLEDLVAALEGRFKIAHFPHSVNVTSAQSDLRVQFQTDARYQAFLDRSERKNVLGRDLPVAAIEDVMQGKVWAYQDPERRPSKRQKDLADILRLIEAHSHLKQLLPDSLRKEVDRVGG